MRFSTNYINHYIGFHRMIQQIEVIVLHVLNSFLLPQVQVFLGEKVFQVLMIEVNIKFHDTKITPSNLDDP